MIIVGALQIDLQGPVVQLVNAAKSEDNFHDVIALTPRTVVDVWLRNSLSLN